MSAVQIATWSSFIALSWRPPAFLVRPGRGSRNRPLRSGCGRGLSRRAAWQFSSPQRIAVTLTHRHVLARRSVGEPRPRLTMRGSRKTARRHREREDGAAPKRGEDRCIFPSFASSIANRLHEGAADEWGNDQAQAWKPTWLSSVRCGKMNALMTPQIEPMTAQPTISERDG